MCLLTIVGQVVPVTGNYQRNAQLLIHPLQPFVNPVLDLPVSIALRVTMILHL